MSNSFLFEIRDKLFHTSLEEFKHYVNHSKISIDAKTAESLFTAIYNKHKKNYTKTWIEYFAYFADISNEIVHVYIDENRRVLEDVLLHGKIDQFKKITNLISKHKGLERYSLNNLIVFALQRKDNDEMGNFISEIDNIKGELLRGGEIANNDQGEIFLVRYAIHKELINAALLLLNKRLGKLTNENEQIFQIAKIKLNKKEFQPFYQFIQNYLEITKCNPRKINISGETFYEKITNKDQKEKIENIIKNYEQSHPQKKQQYIKRSETKSRSLMGAGDHHKPYSTESSNNLPKEKVIVNIQSYEDEVSIQKEANKLYESHIKQKQQQMRWSKQAKPRNGILKKEQLRYYLQEDIRLQVYKMKQENQHYKEIFTQITQKIREILNKINVQLQVFGSFKTQLCLLQSDIDIVVIPNVEPPNFNPGQFLKQISLTLIYMSEFQEVKFISTATVPIIKITCTEKYFHKKFDITYKDKEHNGLQSVQLVKKYLDFYPQLQFLIFILKKFIYTSKLFGPYKGGLSSYGLILMIIAYIQHFYKQYQRENKDTSQILTSDILIGFLKFYGFSMNYVMKSINICNIQNPNQWKNYTRCDNPYVDPLNPISDLQPKLVIIDPLNSNNNVGRATHRIKQIQMGFGIACTAIHAYYTCNKKRRCESYRSILKCNIKQLQFKDNQRPCCIVRRIYNCTKRFLNGRVYQ